MTRSIPSVLVLDVDGLGSSVTIPGITTQALGLNPDVAAEATSGSPYAQTVNFRSMRPEFTFTSYCVDKVLGALGLSGLSLKTTEGTGLNLYLLDIDADCGRVEAGEVHSVIRADAGCGWVTRIQANAGEDATIEARFVLLSADGTTAAITRTDDVAAPANVAETRFGLGKFTFAASVIDNLTSATIDFGVTAESDLTDDAVIPKAMQLSSILPVIDLTTKKSALFAGTIPMVGAIGTNSNSSIYLRKRGLSGSGSSTIPYVANATAEHIKITPTGLLTTQNLDGSGNTAHEVGLRVTTAQASNGDLPLVISIASAIS